MGNEKVALKIFTIYEYQREEEYLSSMHDFYFGNRCRYCNMFLFF